MNVGKKETSINSFSKHVCEFKGCTSMIETYPPDPTSKQTHQHTIMRMISNPYLNECNNPCFILQIRIIDSEYMHPDFAVWVPQGCYRNIIIDEDAKTIMFVKFNKLFSLHKKWVTFIFEFASDQHYWPKDYRGSEQDGWIQATNGFKKGEVIYGDTASSNQHKCLGHIHPVLYTKQDSEKSVFGGPLYLPSITDFSKYSSDSS